MKRHTFGAIAHDLRNISGEVEVNEATAFGLVPSGPVHIDRYGADGGAVRIKNRKERSFSGRRRRENLLERGGVLGEGHQPLRVDGNEYPAEQRQPKVAKGAARGAQRREPPGVPGK